MASADTTSDALARRREADRERQRRHRGKLRLLTDGATSQNVAPGHGERAQIQTAGSPTKSDRPVSSPRVHDTQRLELLGTTPDEFAAVPPSVDYDAPPPPVSADAAAGAKVFGAVLGFMTRFALADAMQRYSLDQMLSGAAGVELPEGLPVGLNPEVVPAAAGAFVAQSAERVALKYGISLHLPYQDEIVTVGAGALSGVYILRMFTGKLGQPRANQPPAASARDEQSPPSPADEPSQYGPIKIGDAPGDGEWSWLHRK